MPKLVAYYLKEFSVKTDGTTSNLYKFIFCLCLPFVSNTFNKARLTALAIAECTDSREQIIRLLKKITGLTVTVSESSSDEYYCGFDDTNDEDCTDFSLDETADSALVTFYPVTNSGYFSVTLGDYSQEQFEAYLALIVPFYVNFKILYL